MAETNYVTKETFEKCSKSPIYERHRQACSKQSHCRSQGKGDLKENAEYDAAKEAQGMLEAKLNSWKE